MRLISEELADVEQRANLMFEWRTPGDSVLDIALDHLTLGRVHLLRAVLSGSAAADGLGPARAALATALDTLRQSNTLHNLPWALLPSAWCHALSGEWELAEQRLNEAFQLATRGGNDPAQDFAGGMRLHLIDTLLHRARLFAPSYGVSLARRIPAGRPRPRRPPDPNHRLPPPRRRTRRRPSRASRPLREMRTTQLTNAMKSQTA